MNSANPSVRLLSEGEKFIAKEMSANRGELLPKHLASVESVLLLQEGSCVLHFQDGQQHLQAGDVFIVPAMLIHQIEAQTDFRAVHIMPKEIQFEFFK